MVTTGMNHLQRLEFFDFLIYNSQSFNMKRVLICSNGDRVLNICYVPCVCVCVRVSVFFTGPSVTHPSTRFAQIERCGTATT